MVGFLKYSHIYEMLMVARYVAKSITVASVAGNAVTLNS